jgi:putative nucleotidyltransferase with HDIG domain
LGRRKAKMYKKHAKQTSENGEYSPARIKKLNQDLEKEVVRLKKTLEQTIMLLISISEMKDPFTIGHQKRVSELATAIAKKMNLPEERIESIRVASLIHDIGKTGIPSDILNKPSKLNESEFAFVKKHPFISYKCIKDVDFPRKVAEIILQHHERLNGTGYPSGLKSKKIMLEAKIISVADVVESMNFHRPYRPALGMDKSLEEISMNKGKLYDSDVAEACIKLFKEDGFKF